jgi:L-ascorbate metabolism protein UlaG (beta-lactamase superfamily)
VGIMTVTVRWIAHATFQIISEKENIYVDLYWRKKYAERVSKPADPATIILSTHNHGDHCDPKAIEMVRTNKSIIIAPKDCAKRIGGKVKSLEPGDEFIIRDVKIKAVQAYNVKRFRKPGQPYHPKGYGVGYLITVEGKTIYHAGDTDLISDMENLENIDVALLPSGDTYTMDNADAAEAALIIKPKYAVPMHTWDKSTDEFKQKIESESEIKVMQLGEGEEFILD